MGPPMPGRIPWAAVRDWCDHHGYDADRMAVLDSGLAAMDAVFIAHCGEVARRGAKGDAP